jgi:hypothetical protein
MSDVFVCYGKLITTEKPLMQKRWHQVSNLRLDIETIGFRLDPQYTHTDFGDLGWPFGCLVGSRAVATPLW